MVSLVQDLKVRGYPCEPPFGPAVKYPELRCDCSLSRDNLIYGMVRKLLHQLDLDSQNYDSSLWNPLGQLIKPGDNVVIKPNFVKHEHYLGQEGLLSTITHGSVLRPIIDYVYIALQDMGKISVCDTSLEYADFEKICQVTGIKETIAYLEDKGYPIELIDLRKYVTKFFFSKKTQQYDQSGDPVGYKIVDLKNQSEFRELDNSTQNYHTLADHTVDHYDPFSGDVGVPNKHHHPGKHEYLISGTILNADVIISVPKLKTHGKAGVTLNLKNMMGIVSGKNYMPHHRPGKPPCGDAFAVAPPAAFIKHRFIRRKIARSLCWFESVVGRSLMKKIAHLGRELILERFWPVRQAENIIQWGDWHGNDTLWRTILDLNKVIMYCDKSGVLTNTPQRKYFSIIDGIIGQEGQGPTTGTPKHTSLLLGGRDPVAVDTIATLIMGFDPKKIKTITKTKYLEKYFLGNCDRAEIRIAYNIDKKIPQHKFKVPRGWEKHIKI
jgi:uncharacterized protein (DUF362 family)